MSSTNGGMKIKLYSNYIGMDIPTKLKDKG